MSSLKEKLLLVKIKNKVLDALNTKYFFYTTVVGCVGLLYWLFN